MEFWNDYTILITLLIYHTRTIYNQINKSYKMIVLNTRFQHKTTVWQIVMAIATIMFHLAIQIELDFTKHSRARSNHTSTKSTDGSNSPSLANTFMLPKYIPWTSQKSNIFETTHSNQSYHCFLNTQKSSSEHGKSCV